MIRIKLTREILVPRFSNFLRYSTINFCMFLYLETCFLTVTVSLLCRVQAASKIHVLNYFDLISEGRPAQQRHSNDWHSNETVTLRKHVTKYKNMQKWMVEFLRKFENRGIKIDRVNSIHITKSVNLQIFTFILYGVGGPL